MVMGINSCGAPGWLGSAGHPQDIAQCRRAVGALRIGAAAIPRGVFEYTTAHVNSVPNCSCGSAGAGAQAPLTLPAHSTCQQPTLAGPAAYHHLPAPPHCTSA
ncbi:hypothetical protein HaLaN_02184 [Haematococcus lacustris]|uniref:Uncharacterized protein n=1 Tax=Haematococcus lacustris TaxID=44745 RepID=A0A699YWG6_HAELA|nr:hypothetical protein HaLaN_02184 [Haematococcus lacustris]